MIKIKGKVILVVGARGGVGSAFVRQFVTAGARVILFSRNRKALLVFSREFPADQTLVVSGDATNPSHIERAFKRGKKKFGRVDAVVITAGEWDRVDLNTPKRKAEELLEKHFREHFKITFETGRVAATFFRKQKHGLIVNVSSHAGIRPWLGGNLTYGPMKAAAHNFILALAYLFKNTRVKVTDITPAIVNTPGNRGALKTKKMRAQAVQPEKMGKWIMSLFDKRRIPFTKLFDSSVKLD